MSTALLIAVVYGLVIYAIVGMIIFGSHTGRWTDPWPADKAFALAVFWPICVFFALSRALVFGIVKLIKEEVLNK